MSKDRDPEPDQSYIHETEPQPVITRLCAAIRLPGYEDSDRRRNVRHFSDYSPRNVLYLGWDSNGRPLSTTDPKNLQDAALIASQNYGPVDCPPGLARFITSTPDVIQYVGMFDPTDIKDIRGKIELDYLKIGYFDTDENEIKQWTVDEQSFLNVTNLENNTVIWQEVTGQDTVEGNVKSAKLMFAVGIPVQERDSVNVRFILFRPQMDTNSNEIAFQMYLIDALKALVSLDAQQRDPAKKGYEPAFEEVIRQYHSFIYSDNSAPQSSGTGKIGDAFALISLFNQAGIIKTDPDRLKYIRKESAKGNPLDQLTLLVMEARSEYKRRRQAAGLEEENIDSINPLTTALFEAFEKARQNLSNKLHGRFR